MKYLMFLSLTLALPASSSGQRYQYLDSVALDVHKDTVFWIHHRDAKARTLVPDTIVFVIKSDSSVTIVRPGPVRKLPEDGARHFRFLVSEAKASERLLQRIPAVP
jgi:hypothetical protein